jgi:quercetin dioxygenase-like cupin family protein
MTGGPHDPGESRLRQAPTERFQGDSHDFDLEAVARRLLAEDHPARDGHRQITLFQREHITHVVFAFERDGHLPEHVTPGLVTIHVHRGRIHVDEAGRAHDLTAGRVLVLDPGVPHSVRAREESVMLLTVHLERHPH